MNEKAARLRHIVKENIWPHDEDYQPAMDAVDEFESLSLKLNEALERDRKGDEIIVDLTLERDRLAAAAINHPTDICECRFDCSDGVLKVRHECGYHKAISSRLGESERQVEFWKDRANEEQADGRRVSARLFDAQNRLGETEKVLAALEQLHGAKIERIGELEVRLEQAEKELRLYRDLFGLVDVTAVERRVSNSTAEQEVGDAMMRMGLPRPPEKTKCVRCGQDWSSLELHNCVTVTAHVHDFKPSSLISNERVCSCGQYIVVLSETRYFSILDSSLNTFDFSSLRLHRVARRATILLPTSGDPR